MPKQEAGAPGATTTDDMTDDPDACVRKQHSLISSLRRQIQRYESQVRILQMQLLREAETRQVILSSTSWRIAGPLRHIVDRWRSKQLPLPSVSMASDTNNEETEPERIGTLTAKRLFERIAQAQLRAFLTSGSRLNLPNAIRPKLSIILVLYNNAALTFSCLRSIRECASEISIEVIIVDNASTDESAPCPMTQTRTLMPWLGICRKSGPRFAPP